MLLTCAHAEDIEEGERIAIDPRAGCIRRENGSELLCDTVPDFLLDMVDAGGLLNVLKQRYRTPDGMR